MREDTGWDSWQTGEQDHLCKKVLSSSESLHVSPLPWDGVAPAQGPGQSSFPHKPFNAQHLH